MLHTIAGVPEAGPVVLLEGLLAAHHVEGQDARIDVALHMPMNDVPDRLEELNPDQEIVVLCHHGRRSRQVVVFLKQSGFRQVLNLVGGIDAWSAEVDPGVPVY